MPEVKPSTWEVVSEQSDHNRYYAIIADMPSCNRTGVIFDTLNCDHILTLDEQRALAVIVSAVPEMLKACKAMLVADTDRERLAAQTLARQAVTKALPHGGQLLI